MGPKILMVSVGPWVLTTTGSGALVCFAYEAHVQKLGQHWILVHSHFPLFVSFHYFPSESVGAGARIGLVRNQEGFIQHMK